MDLSLLQTFAEVARRGSFAAVAREEGVDPSSVSRRIAALEQALGFVLFERTTRRLSLTEAGRIYLDRIDAILDSLTEAADTARDMVASPSGLLRVTTSVAFGERWLTPRLAGFRAAYPAIQLEMILTDAQIDIAAEGIDVALRLGPEVRGTFVAAKLFDVRYRAVASPAYLRRNGRPETPADLAAHDGLFFSLPSYGMRWRFRRAADAAPQEVFPKPALSTNNALALRRAAQEGLGVALLADWTIQADLESGQLVDLFPDFEGSAMDFDTAVWTVYPSRAYVSARLRAFLDYIRDSV
ncbi:LysR substrate-binding domain-containing protein [Donghicola sp. XS_ASV15]|uniref:LysR family transcriptional regulator n=1 Tax=Donghicola sp. XS_ASV15 TaxID=3241295 RepID=UPI0035147E2D